MKKLILLLGIFTSIAVSAECTLFTTLTRSESQMVLKDKGYNVVLINSHDSLNTGDVFTKVMYGEDRSLEITNYFSVSYKDTTIQILRKLEKGYELLDATKTFPSTANDENVAKELKKLKSCLL